MLYFATNSPRRVVRDELSCDELSCDELSCDELSCDELSCDKLSCDELSCDELSCDELSCDELSCDELSGPRALYSPQILILLLVLRIRYVFFFLKTTHFRLGL